MGRLKPKRELILPWQSPFNKENWNKYSFAIWQDLKMTQINQELKEKLFNQIEVAGKERSLLPFSETLIDGTIKQLEDINPIPQPGEKLGLVSPDATSNSLYFFIPFLALNDK